jgi:SAM-dependent methyltransferase
MLSDFTARPVVIEQLGDMTGRRVVDLGCGEGYVSRLLCEAGAGYVDGFDISPEMVRRAKEGAPAHASARLSYAVRDLGAGGTMTPHSYDDAIAVFLLNYLSCAATSRVFELVRHCVRPGGQFIFTVPHPALAWLKPHSKPFYFDGEGQTYRGAIDSTLEGLIWRTDGKSVPVRAVHKTFSDYNRLLREAGFDAMPTVRELYAEPAHIAQDPDFFGPLEGIPLHVLYQVPVP